MNRRFRPPADSREHDVVDSSRARRRWSSRRRAARATTDTAGAGPCAALIDVRGAMSLGSPSSPSNGRARSRVRRRGAGRAGATDRADELGGSVRGSRIAVEQQLRRIRRGCGRPLCENGRRKVGKSDRAEESRRRHPRRRRSTNDASSAGAPRARFSSPSDQPDLPQRTFAIEQTFLDTRCQGDELLPRAGPRERGVTNVYVMSKRSSRPRSARPCRRATLITVCEAREERRPRQHEIAHGADAEVAVGIEERLTFEHAHRADVHRISRAAPMCRKLASSAVSRSYSVIAPDATRGTGYGLRRMPESPRRSGPSRGVVLALDAQLGFPGRQLRERIPDVLVERRSHARMAAPPGRWLPRARALSAYDSGKRSSRSCRSRRSSCAPARPRGPAAHPLWDGLAVLRRARRGTRSRKTLATTATIMPRPAAGPIRNGRHDAIATRGNDPTAVSRSSRYCSLSRGVTPHTRLPGAHLRREPGAERGSSYQAGSSSPSMAQRDVEPAVRARQRLR